VVRRLPKYKWSQRTLHLKLLEHIDLWEKDLIVAWNIGIRYGVPYVSKRTTQGIISFISHGKTLEGPFPE